jgi:hypothetical protein
MHKAFSYNGKRQLSKQIIERLASYVGMDRWGKEHASFSKKRHVYEQICVSLGLSVSDYIGWKEINRRLTVNVVRRKLSVPGEQGWLRPRCARTAGISVRPYGCWEHLSGDAFDCTKPCSRG